MKRKDIPERFPVDKLSEFDFGDIDAFRDTCLFHAFCYTDFVEMSRQHKRTILVGAKGSGKSAVFKAFLEGEVNPLPVNNCNPIIIGISEELKYLDTAKIIKEKFSIYGYSEDFKYALLWDFYILFRILIELRKNYYGNFSEKLKKLSSFFQHIEVNEKSSLTIFLDKLKNIKFVGSMTDGTTVYTGAVEYKDTKNFPEENKFALYSIKEEINSILNKNNAYLWVMIDKIDDFLIREAYDVQRKLLQGLVVTEDSYSQYEQLYIKIFIRSDLYEKIDFSFIGYDKISGRKVDFHWQPYEIRRFLAQRLAYNLIKILDIKHLAFDISEKALTESTITDLQQDTGIRKLISDKRQGRRISIDDALSRRVITMIYPRVVMHIDSDGKRSHIDLFKFIETHFNLATDQPTPRSLLLFLDKTIQHCKAYYETNWDEKNKVTIDERREYPLIKRKCFEDAYGALIKDICTYIVNHDQQWKPYISKFFNEKGKKRIFSYNHIKKIIGIDDAQLKQLLAFLEHIGCLKCICAFEPHTEKCKYELPVFFQALDFYH